MMPIRRIHVSRKKIYCLLILFMLYVLMVWIDTKGTISTSVYHVFSRTTQRDYYERSVPNDYLKANYSVYINGSETTTKMASHVRFLKVFKAGSTTVQNLLFRFALRHNLLPLLPIKTNEIYDKHRAMPIPASEHFDIFAVHTQYSKKFFDSILPKDSINIAIVRDPAERLISAAYYYRDVHHRDYLMRVPKENFIHNLVRHPELYEIANFSHTKNSMGRDFGFPMHVSHNDTETVTEYLEMLNSEFKFVMIMEQFETSLVLLRRLLNWSLKDIVVLQANSYSHPAAVLTPHDITKLKTTCFLDYVIYDFFMKRFEEKVELESPSLEGEVKHFSAVLKKIKTYCDGKISNKEPLKIESTKWNEEFKVSRKDCILMKTPELEFINELRERHRKLFSKSTPSPL